MSENKKREYWQEWKNVEIELQEVIRTLGHFPTLSELRDLKKASLSVALLKYHGGTFEARKRLDYKENIKPMGYWEKWEHVQLELDELWKKFPELEGKVPSAWWMQKNRYGALVTAINQYHDGIKNVREKLGQDSPTKESGYWKQWENVEQELQIMWQKHPELEGRLPPEHWMRKQGYNHLGSAVTKHYGGFRQFRERLGQEQPQKYRGGKLKDWKVLEEEINKILRENGKLSSLPSVNWLGRHGYSGVADAIRKYHGGFSRVREKLGEEKPRRDMSDFKDSSKVRSELQKIIEEHPEVNEQGLNYSWLESNGFGYIYRAILMHHGGLEAFKDVLGDLLTRKSKGYWLDWNNCEKEIKVLASELGHFPSQKEFSSRGMSGLAQALYKSHGGMQTAKERLGFPSFSQQFKHLQKAENFQEELQQIIKQLDHFPSKKELLDLQRRDFIKAIKYHGGFRKISGSLGLSKPRKEDGYYHNWENVEQELRPMISEYGGRLPPLTKFRKIGRFDLVTAISLHGGIEQVREKLGLSKEAKYRGWRDWEEIKSELEKIIQENNGKFPNRQKVKELGKSGIYSAIFRYHGGVSEVKKRLAIEPRSRNQGYWKDKENVKREIEEIMARHKLSRLPTGKQLAYLRYSSVAMAIQKYHGGFVEFRELIGENSKRIKNKLWGKEDFIINHARKIMEKYNFTTLPSQTKLEKLGEGAFILGVSRYHGGMRKFREKLGLQQIQIEKGAWKDETFTVNYVQEFFSRNGLNYLPSHTIMNKMGENRLASAINKYYGGFRAFRELIRQRLGLKSEQNKLESILDEYIEGENDKA